MNDLVHMAIGLAAAFALCVWLLRNCEFQINNELIEGFGRFLLVAGASILVWAAAIGLWVFVCEVGVVFALPEELSRTTEWWKCLSLC